MQLIVCHRAVHLHGCRLGHHDYYHLSLCPDSFDAVVVGEVEGVVDTGSHIAAVEFDFGSVVGCIDAVVGYIFDVAAGFVVAADYPVAVDFGVVGDGDIVVVVVVEAFSTTRFLFQQRCS
eukprot:m.28178 g.28178  ORF g.28178 m.28178 type:complete len:120 (-) comp7978_c2_seq2:1164-1523(-)